jgi:magnesium-transporting ATPase (P-type)
MNKYKRNLIILLCIQIILTLNHVVLRESFILNESNFNLSWHFWIGLLFGIFVILYAISLRCPNPACHRMQVFRGISVFDIKWPNDKCYSCGTHLSE